MNAPTASVPNLLSPQEASVYADTRELLAHAKRDARRRNFQDVLICDIDAHHVETVSWKEIVRFIEDPVIREQRRMDQQKVRGAPAEAMATELRERDRRDRSRAASPLAATPDAVILDSTHMSEDSVLQKIEDLVRDKLGAGQ